MPVVQINEFNTSSQTETSGITSLGFGSSDSANLSVGSNGVQLSTTTTSYSYEKWLRLVCTSLEGYVSISNIKFWRSTGALGGLDSIKTNAGTGGSYSAITTFSTPVTTASSNTPNTLPGSEPASANIGINSSLSSTISNLSVLDRSDFLVLQLNVHKDTRGGSELGFTFAWQENM